MKILLIGKHGIGVEMEDEVMDDSFNISNDIDGAINVLKKLETISLLIIFGTEPNVFYAMLKRLNNEFSQPCQLMLVNPDELYFMVSESEKNVIYHSSI